MFSKLVLLQQLFLVLNVDVYLIESAKCGSMKTLFNNEVDIDKY